MIIYSITGWSGSGKTTLITRLITHFKESGKTVAAVKHAPNKYHIEPESKDSFKFLDAGAEEVCLLAKHQRMTMNPIPESWDPFNWLQSHYAQYDVLLLEGLHTTGIPMIEVFNPSLNQPLKYPIETLCAVISPIPIQETTPCFTPESIPEIAQFMEVYHG